MCAAQATFPARTPEQRLNSLLMSGKMVKDLAGRIILQIRPFIIFSYCDAP
jgi:hypothetical protein